MLISSGERERGERLLRASLADMDHVAHDLKRGELWYVIDRATALALLGDRKAALAALHHAVGAGYLSTWSLMESDPAFDTLRGEAEFQQPDARDQGQAGPRTADPRPDEGGRSRAGSQPRGNDRKSGD